MEDTKEFTAGFAHGNHEASVDIEKKQAYLYVIGGEEFNYKVDEKTGLILKNITEDKDNDFLNETELLKDDRTGEKYNFYLQGRKRGYNMKVDQWMSSGKTPVNSYKGYTAWISSNKEVITKAWSLEKAKKIEGKWTDPQSGATIYKERYKLDPTNTKNTFQDRVVVENKGKRFTFGNGNDIISLSTRTVEYLPHAVAVIVDYKINNTINKVLYVIDTDEMMVLTEASLSKTDKN